MNKVQNAALSQKSSTEEKYIQFITQIVNANNQGKYSDIKKQIVSAQEL